MNVMIIIIIITNREQIFYSVMLLTEQPLRTLQIKFELFCKRWDKWAYQVG